MPFTHSSPSSPCHFPPHGPLVASSSFPNTGPHTLPTAAAAARFAVPSVQDPQQVPRHMLLRGLGASDHLRMRAAGPGHTDESLSGGAKHEKNKSNLLQIHQKPRKTGSFKEVSCHGSHGRFLGYCNRFPSACGSRSSAFKNWSMRPVLTPKRPCFAAGAKHPTSSRAPAATARSTKEMFIKSKLQHLCCNIYIYIIYIYMYVYRHNIYIYFMYTVYSTNWFSGSLVYVDLE